MQNKIIFIKAECEYFSIQEQIEEQKAVRRLEVIRRMFEYMQKRNNGKGSLKVKTGEVNPAMMFGSTIPQTLGFRKVKAA